MIAQIGYSMVERSGVGDAVCGLYRAHEDKKCVFLG
jgi:hypothetical protein